MKSADIVSNKKSGSNIAAGPTLVNRRFCLQYGTGSEVRAKTCFRSRSRFQQPGATLVWKRYSQMDHSPVHVSNMLRYHTATVNLCSCLCLFKSRLLAMCKPMLSCL